MALLFGLSIPAAIGAAIGLFIVGYFLQAVFTGIFTPLAHLPGPWYTRFTHLRLKRAVITGGRSFYIHQLHQQYGPIVRISPFEVAVSDLESFQKIHKVGGGFLKSIWYQKLANFPKLGVFTMIEPKEHGARRRVLSRPFSRTYIMEHWDQKIKEKCALAVSQIKRNALQGKSDVFKWWLFLASDVSAHLAFGESFHNLEAGVEAPYIIALKKLTMGAGMMVEMPIFRLLRFVPIKPIQQMFNANKFILDGAAKAVELAKSRSGESNLFAKIIDDRKKGEGTLDDVDVQIEATNVIVAGTDTTGVTLTYLTWCALQRPELQAKLEAEVAQLGENFSETDVTEKCPLLNATIEETLRLFGAAPSSLPRIVPAGGTEMAGHFIPAGATVSTQAYTLHRDENIFKNPLDFDPQRWLDPNLSPQAKIAFHPFGAGARSCIGIHIARMELRYAAAFFFKECAGAKLHAETTPASMAPINFFLIAPISHHCFIEMKN